MEQRLKEAVECIVAPIPALETGKNKLREELYSHLRELFEVERTVLGDDEAALEAALARLGSGEAIRAAYLNNMSRFERAMGRIEYFTEFDPSVSGFTVATKFTAFIALGLVAVWCVLFPIFVLAAGLERAVYNSVTFGVTMSVWVCGWTLGSFSIVYPFQRALRSALSRRGRLLAWLRYQGLWVIEYAVISIMTWLVSNAIVSAFLGGNDPRALEFAYMSGYLLLAFTVINLPILPYSIYRAESERQPIPEWPYEQSIYG